MGRKLWAGLLCVPFCAVAAGNDVEVAAGGVKVYRDGRVELGSGSVGSDVQMEGFAIINGEVYVDGEKVPRGKKTVTSKKTGKTYRIEWGKNGNVSVTEQ